MKLSDHVKVRRDGRSGYYKVSVPTQVEGGKRRWISTGETSRRRAEEVVREAGVDRLIQIAHAKALTADAISIITTGRKFTAADALKAWKEEMGTAVADGTITSYCEIVEQFLSESKNERTPVAMITKRALYSFVNDDKMMASTRRNRLAAMRSFYKFTQSHGYTLSNPTLMIRVNPSAMTLVQMEPRHTAPVTEMEYNTLMASLQPGFWRWAVVLGYKLGYRMVDVCCLEFDSLREDAVLIYPKKTPGKRLFIPTDNAIVGGEDLKQAIAEIRAQQTHPTYCFPEQRTVRLSDSRAALSVEFGRIMKRCGIKGKTFHSLRSGFKKRLDDLGVPIETIAQMMGHSDTKTTEIYGHEKD